MACQALGSHLTAKIRSTLGQSATGIIFNNETGKSFSFRVEDKSYLDLQVLEKIVAQVATASHALMTSRTFEYHLIDDQKEHSYILVSDVSYGQACLKIEKIYQKNFKEMQKLIRRLTPEKFLNDLEDYPLIKVNSNEGLTSTPIQKKPTHKEIEIDKSIEYNSAIFILSDELIRGMKGQRGSDHKLSPEVLDACLRNKLNHLIRNTTKETENRYVFDLKASEINTDRPLRLVIDHYAQRSTDQKLRFNIITAYYTHQ